MVDNTARDAYLNLVRVHERLAGEFSELFRDRGITPAQYNVLRILLGAPKEGAPCQYIRDRLLNRLPDVTRLIDRMLAAGLVTRGRYPADRRVVLVQVTAKGRRLCEKLAGPVTDLHKKQFGHMKPTAVKALSEGLQEALKRP